MTAKQAFGVWFDAMKAEQPKETVRALWDAYMVIDREEKGMREKPIRIETSYRRNGRPFSVAVYADGTTADLD